MESRSLHGIHSDGIFLRSAMHVRSARRAENRPIDVDSRRNRARKFEWARAQSWHARESAKICGAFDAFGVDTVAQQDLNELINSKEFKSWMSAKFGLHRPQSNYAPVSSRLTPATLVGQLFIIGASRRHLKLMHCVADKNARYQPGGPSTALMGGSGKNVLL